MRVRIKERRFDKSNGYWWVKLTDNRYMPEHLWVWIKHGNAFPDEGFVIHHKDENKTNNRYANLQLLTRAEHSRLHSTGRKISRKTRAKMRQAAARRCADPKHIELLRKRAKAQHKAGKLGRVTWGPDSAPSKKVLRQLGLKQADRLREMIQATPSEEMSRRSYCRKIFQPGA